MGLPGKIILHVAPGGTVRAVEFTAVTKVKTEPFDGPLDMDRLQGVTAI